MFLLSLPEKFVCATDLLLLSPHKFYFSIFLLPFLQLLSFSFLPLFFQLILSRMESPPSLYLSAVGPSQPVPWPKWFRPVILLLIPLSRMGRMVGVVCIPFFGACKEFYSTFK